MITLAIVATKHLAADDVLRNDGGELQSRLLPPETKPQASFCRVFPGFLIRNRVPCRAKVFGFARPRDY